MARRAAKKPAGKETIDHVRCVGRRGVAVAVDHDQKQVHLVLTLGTPPKTLATPVLDTAAARQLQTALNRACNLLGA